MKNGKQHIDPQGHCQLSTTTEVLNGISYRLNIFVPVAGEGSLSKRLERLMEMDLKNSMQLSDISQNGEVSNSGA